MNSKDSNVEQRLSCEDQPKSMSDVKASVRTMIEVVRPLVRGGSNPVALDIFEDIVLPAQQCRWSEQLEIEQLCAVFSLVLEQVGNSILTTLATYLPTCAAEHTLKHFIDSMENLVDQLECAYDTSLIEAFRIGLLKGFDDEQF
jgi:hypothetical protein